MFLSLDTLLPFPHPPLRRRGLCDLIIFVSLSVMAIVYLLQWAFDTHLAHSRCSLGFPGGSDSKESACNAGDAVRSLGWEDPLKEEMATHCSVLVWNIPEEPGGVQSMGL